MVRVKPRPKSFRARVQLCCNFKGFLCPMLYNTFIVIGVSLFSDILHGNAFSRSRCFKYFWMMTMKLSIFSFLGNIRRFFTTVVKIHMHPYNKEKWKERIMYDSYMIVSCIFQNFATYYTNTIGLVIEYIRISFILSFHSVSHGTRARH